MVSTRTIILRGLSLGLLAAILGAGALLLYVNWYTGTNRILPGVVVGHVPVGGLQPREAARRLSVSDRLPAVQVSGLGSAAGVQASPEAPLMLVWEDRSWPLSRAEFEPIPDVQGAVKAALSIGRSGSLWHRARSILVGYIHGHHVSLARQMRDEAARTRLEAIAPEVYVPARDARYDFDTDTMEPESPGQELDVAASLDAVRAATLAGLPEARLVVQSRLPAVTRADLTSAKRYRIARFTTPILAADPGRVHNISMSLRKISGYVIQSGHTFSFNDVVGPRDAAGGWAQAKELYQGEFVLGYGGGICQVSSTLYNAVLLAGLDVRERFHHDRPLQYVSPGRDATVAWKVLDFKFRNSLGVPVLVSGKVIAGSPQQIEVSLYAPHLIPEGRIRLEEADVRYFPPEMAEIPDPNLAANERIVIDEGHAGIELKVFRVFQDGPQERRELVSHDHYQPKAGKVRVGVESGPGSVRSPEQGQQETGQ